MTPFVVASFAAPENARDAASRLADAGFPAGDVKVHEGVSSASYAGTIEIDEALTGGAGGSLLKLLHGLLLTPPDVDALTYEDAVRKEGTIVSVTLRSADDGDRAVALLEANGAQRVARLPQPGLEE